MFPFARLIEKFFKFFTKASLFAPGKSVNVGKKKSIFAGYVTQLQNMIFFFCLKFDSLITQHSTRYLMKTRVQKQGGKAITWTTPTRSLTVKGAPAGDGGPGSQPAPA